MYDQLNVYLKFLFGVIATVCVISILFGMASAGGSLDQNFPEDACDVTEDRVAEDVGIEIEDFEWRQLTNTTLVYFNSSNRSQNGRVSCEKISDNPNISSWTLRREEFPEVSCGVDTEELSQDLELREDDLGWRQIVENELIIFNSTTGQSVVTLSCQSLPVPTSTAEPTSTDTSESTNTSPPTQTDRSTSTSTGPQSVVDVLTAILIGIFSTEAMVVVGISIIIVLIVQTWPDNK